MNKSIDDMTGPELAAEWNRLNPGKPVKRFKNREAGLKRLKSIAPVKKKADTGGVRKRFGNDLRRMVVRTDPSNPRRVGTKAAAKWDDMVKFLKTKPQASLADVFKSTKYQRRDYDWDLNCKNIKSEPL